MKNAILTFLLFAPFFIDAQVNAENSITTLELIDKQQLIGDIKKDTILVGIACEIEGYVGMVKDFTMLKKCRLIEVRNVYQERTLEWREPGKSYWVGRDSLMTWWLPSQYTPIETKWLDPIDGCYRLIPLIDHPTGDGQ